ncbi:MAG: hypothetical protein FJ144_24470 [Deltaproteobacteria bacterium]|nr:hypothetical protein [Deltaproteobacteria bacterium]
MNTKGTVRAIAGVSRAGWQRRGLAPCILALALAACGSPSPVETNADGHVDILIASDEPGAGGLAIDYDFTTPIEVFESASIGGMTLWSGADPGLMQLFSDEPDEGFYVLDDDVTVSLEIVALDPAAKFKFGGVTLDEPGDSVVLGTTPRLHGHGEWQLVLPEDVHEGAYELSFRVTTESETYADSATTTAILAPVEGEEDHEHEEEEE